MVYEQLCCCHILGNSALLYLDMVFLAVCMDFIIVNMNQI